VLGADGALDGRSGAPGSTARRRRPPWPPTPTRSATTPYTVTDADVAAIRRAGYSEDQIFELTVAVAVGDGYQRLVTSLTSDGGGAVRLARVDSGHALPSRLFLRLIRKVAGGEPPDVLKTISYRPDVFGHASPILSRTPCGARRSGRSGSGSSSPPIRPG